MQVRATPTNSRLVRVRSAPRGSPSLGNLHEACYQIGITHRQEHGMATGTNLEHDFQHACDTAAQRRWVGDYDGALYWENEAATYAARIELMEHRSKWDVLKGSPEHG